MRILQNFPCLLLVFLWSGDYECQAFQTSCPQVWSQYSQCDRYQTVFQVSTSGTSHQWQVSTNGGSSWSNLVNGANYGGVTSTQLFVYNVNSSMNNYRYRARVTNRTCSIFSEPELLSVPQITSHPMDAYASIRGSVTFTATAAGSGLSYKWQRQPPGITDWYDLSDDANFSNTSSTTLTVNNIYEWLDGNKFRLFASRSVGCPVPSEGATLRIGEAPVPVACGYSNNSFNNITHTPCINLPSRQETISSNMAVKGYFLMNVIQGFTYQVYTGNNTAPSNQLSLSIYREGTSSNAAIAYSSKNSNNPATNTNNNVFTSFTPTFSGQVRVLLNSAGNCTATSPTGIIVYSNVTAGSNSLDNQQGGGLSANTWMGHIYDGTNQNVSINGSFNNYLGHYTIGTETFNQNFNGETACFPVFSGGSIRANIYTETFSVRYRMNSNKRGLYIVDLGSDDGSRLTVDENLVYNNWMDQGYLVRPRVLLNLKGNSRLVYDFYENGGGNQVSFTNLSLILKNELTQNVTQTISLGGAGRSIAGDVYGTLPNGISRAGTGYQWSYSLTPTGSRFDIPGATSATFTPNPSSAPFNTTGTYYVYRNAIVSSINNFGVSGFNASNESNVATVVIDNRCPTPPTVSISAPSITCAGMVDLSGTFTGSPPWTVQATFNGQPTTITFNQPSSTFALNVQQNTTIVLTRITDGNSCVNETPNAAVTINVVNNIPSNTISGNQASCSSFTPEPLTGNNLGDGYQYTWEASTVSSTSGFSPAPGINNQFSYSPGTISSNTWFRRKVNLSNCAESISNVVKVTINSAIVNNHISLSNGTSGTLRATANENGQLVMNSPAESVFTYVDFASYGTPNDTNGIFSINSVCHSQNSLAVVESYLLGNTTATIPATNAVFGDPCVGTVKRLYVEATYGQNSITICAGVNPGIIPGSTPQGGTSNTQYLWEMSTTGASEGFSAATGTNTGKDYNPGALEVTTWFRRKVNSGNCGTNISNAVRIEVKQIVPVPTATNNGPLCEGATLNLNTTDVAGATYQWTGPNNFSSTLRDPVITNVNPTYSGDYSVAITINNCTSEYGSTSVVINPITPSIDNDDSFGSNSWIGHVYDGLNFETYIGLYSEPEIFFQNFGGGDNCFSLTSNGNPTSIYTQSFSVRYRNLSTKNGIYVVDLRSDDGIRFIINEETIHDNWMDRSPTTDSNVLLNLDQQENLLVYEYFENSGSNEVGFQNLRKITDNKLESGIQQILCNADTPQPIVGDGFTLVPGITAVGTGYQWVYSTTENGEEFEIPGATQKDFTPDLSLTPFNEPGEYFIYRRISLQSSNNRLIGTSNYTSTHTSNAATLLIGQIPQVEFTVTPLELCAPGNIEFSGTFFGSGSYLVSLEVNGISMGNSAVTSNNFVIPYAVNSTTTFTITSITDLNTGCVNEAPNASVTVVVNQPISDNQIIGDQQLCGYDAPEVLTGSVPQGGNGTFTYEWLSSIVGPDDEFAPASGTNSNATYYPGQLIQTTWFKRKVFSGGCDENISNAVQVSLNEEISNNIISYSGNTSICLGTSASIIAGTEPSGGSGDFTYIWESSTIGATEGFSPATGVNNNLNYAPQGITQTTWYRRVVTSNNSPCSENISNVVELTINPLPTAVIEVPDTVCAGQNISISAVLSGTGPWRMSVKMNNGSPIIFDVSTRNFHQTLPIDQTTFFEVLTITDLGTSCVNSNPGIAFTVEVTNEWIWTGAQDTNWNNTNNWSCNRIPTLQTDVFIPNNLASGNYPQVTVGNNALAKDLIIENGASITVTQNWLRIAGVLQNFGSFNALSGSVSFEGGTAQSISDGTFNEDRIENLRIDNAAGVTSAGHVEITGTLRVDKGNFYTSNALTLISNAEKTALIDGSGMGEVLGTVTMQRYLDVAYGYKYFSSPFQNSKMTDFAPFMNLTNPSTGFPHTYRYNENRNVDINGTVEDATGWEVHSGNLNISEGYALNFGDSNDSVLVGISGNVNNGPIPAKTLLNHHREYTRGFHLVGNPYPSPIDWNADNGWTKTNLDNAIYFFTAGATDQYTGSYTSYVNDVSTSDSLVDGRSSNIIPSMQGFFIKVSDSETEDMVTGTFGMDNRVRTDDFSQEFLKTSERDRKQLLRFTAGFKDDSQKDVMVIYFSPYSTLNFEKEFDAHKLMNSDPAIPNFYNITPNKKELAINAIPFPASGNYNKIPLGIKAENSGKMSIALSSLENVPSNFNIYLIDHSKGIGQNLSQNPDYTFEITKGTHNSRFELMFSEEKITNPAIAFNEPFHVEVINNEVVVKLNLEENQEGILQASTIIGQILQVRKGKGKESIVFDGITSDGVYIINLLMGEARYSKKIIIKK